MIPIWEGPYKISRVGGKGKLHPRHYERQGDREAMERLQLEKVPCVISHYIKTRRLKQLNGHHLASRGLSSCYAIFYN